MLYILCVEARRWDSLARSLRSQCKRAGVASDVSDVSVAGVAVVAGETSEASKRNAI